MVRPAALPTASASLRMRFIRASGAKGLPFTMPIAAICPAISGSIASAGCACTASFNISQKLKSEGGMVLTTRPVPSTNVGLVGLLNAPSRPCPFK